MTYGKPTLDLNALLEQVLPELEPIKNAKKPQFQPDIKDKRARAAEISKLEDDWYQKEKDKQYKAIDRMGNVYVMNSPYRTEENYTDEQGRYWVVRYKPRRVMTLDEAKKQAKHTVPTSGIKW